MNSVAEKPCSRCKVSKAITSENFHRNAYSPDGFKSICRLCTNSRAREVWAEPEGRDARLVSKRMATDRWRDSNPEQARAVCRAWRSANLEYANAYNRAYKKRRADKNRLWARNRRARVRQAEGNHTVEDVAKQYAAQNGLCYWCLRELGDKFHVDHLIPLNRGGGNGPDNIVCSCPRCNTSRRDRLPSEWQVT